MPGETPIEGVPPQRKAELPLSESGRRVLDSLGLAPMLVACLDPLSPLNKMTHDEILAAAAELSPDLPSFLYISDMDKLPVIPGKDRIFAAKKAAVQAVNATYPVGTDVKVLQNALKAASQTYQGLGLSGERITELGLSELDNIFPPALVLLQQAHAMKKVAHAESISAAPTEPGDDLIKAALFWSAVSAKLMNKVDHDEQNIPALLSIPGSPESGETSESKATVMQMAAEMVFNKISEDILLRLGEAESVADDGSQLDGLTAQAEGHATRLFGAEEEQDKLHQRFFNALVAINMFTDGKLGKANKGSTSGGVLSIEIAAPLQGRNGNPSVYVEVARDGIYLYKQSTDGRRSPYYNKYDRQIHGKQYEPLEDFFQRTVAKAREEAMASRLSPDKMESITRLLEQCELAIKAVAETKETSAKQYAKNYDRLRRWHNLLQDRDGNPLFGDIVASDRYGEVLILHRVHRVAAERVGRHTGNGDIVVAVTGEGMYEINVTGEENSRGRALALVRQELWKPYQGTPEEFSEYLNAAIESAVKKMPPAEHTAALQTVIEGLLPQMQAASERLGPFKKTQAERYRELLALNKLLVANGRFLLMYQEQEYENYGRCSVFFNPMGEMGKKAIVVSENAVYEVDIPYEEIHITSILASVINGAENHQWRVYAGTGEELAGFLKQAIEQAIGKMTDSEKVAALPELAKLNIQVSLPPAEAGGPAESGLAEAISATLQVAAQNKEARSATLAEKFKPYAETYQSLHEINKCLGLKLGAELYMAYALLPEKRRFILFKTRKAAPGTGAAQSVLVFTAEGVFEAQLPAGAPESVERAFAEELGYEEKTSFKRSINLYNWEFHPYTGSPEELATHLKQAIEECVLPLPREDLLGVLDRLKELGISITDTAPAGEARASAAEVRAITAEQALAVRPDITLEDLGQLRQQIETQQQTINQLRDRLVADDLGNALLAHSLGLPAKKEGEAPYDAQELSVALTRLLTQKKEEARADRYAALEQLAETLGFTPKGDRTALQLLVDAYSGGTGMVGQQELKAESMEQIAEAVVMRIPPETMERLRALNAGRIFKQVGQAISDYVTPGHQGRKQYIDAMVTCQPGMRLITLADMITGIGRDTEEAAAFTQVAEILKSTFALSLFLRQLSVPDKQAKMMLSLVIKICTLMQRNLGQEAQVADVGDESLL